MATLAGQLGFSGFANGTGSAARFANPEDAAVDDAGNVYVADTLNHVIRKIDPAGVVTTLAGMPGVSGFADAARFNRPVTITTDRAGNLFVGDLENELIRKIGNCVFAEQITLYFAHFADGLGLFSQILLSNLVSAMAANVTVEVRARDGQFMNIDLNKSE